MANLWSTLILPCAFLPKVCSSLHQHHACLTDWLTDWPSPWLLLPACHSTVPAFPSSHHAASFSPPEKLHWATFGAEVFAPWVDQWLSMICYCVYLQPYFTWGKASRSISHQRPSKPVQTRSNLTKLLQACPDLFKLVQTHPDLSSLINLIWDK